MPEALPKSKKLAYACGMLGWSIMINIISVIVIYFYLPPSNSGMVNLISQVAIFGAFNAMSVIMAGSKLFDIIADPFIAHATDNSRHSKGRRIPFMRLWIVPAFVFCGLVFFPLYQGEHAMNVLWLGVMLTLFFISATAYAIPYNALLPELAHTPEEKLTLSSLQSIGFVAGVGLSSNAFNFTDMLQSAAPGLARAEALQFVVWGLAFVAAIAMSIPVFTINEKRYAHSQPSTASIGRALGQTLRNRNFLIFITADLVYFTAVALITSGLMYYVTVLAGLQERAGNKLMITMVAVSLLFYPLVARVAVKTGKKKLVVFAFAVMSLVFLAIYTLGKMPVSSELQLYLLVAVFAIPFAVLGILPNAIVAEIAERDSRQTGQSKEGMYYAVRLLFDKLGQMLGLSLFAFLTMYGKDSENDSGLRLSGLAGCILCVAAALIYSAFRENRKG